MSATPEMPSVRRRAIPGLGTAPSAAPPPRPQSAPLTGAAAMPEPPLEPRADDGGHPDIPPARRPAADYGSTRLVNFRLPIDLHDRYKVLVREAEARHPRLRHPSLTEVLIGLLEEGPTDAEAVVELIRRKRASEHGVEL